MSARILVADDIEANRRVLQGKLEAHFHVVLEASNGMEAIEVARNERPEIILLDVMMPGIDGYETCRRLKADPLTSHIPVVMVTALSDSEERVRGLEVGAEDFITKPVDDFQLNSRIEALRRYNMVAHELRQRQGRGGTALEFDDNETEDINRKVRILIMDEHPRRSRRIKAMLADAGHEVYSYLEAGGGAALSSTGVDVIILPLSDQSFDPLKICTHFRMTEMTRPISIIVASEPHETQLAARALVGRRGVPRKLRDQEKWKTHPNRDHSGLCDQFYVVALTEEAVDQYKYLLRMSSYRWADRKVGPPPDCLAMPANYLWFFEVVKDRKVLGWVDFISNIVRCDASRTWRLPRTAP